MLKYPPLSLSRSRQNMEGESKSGLGVGVSGGVECGERRGKYQHMKSILPSIPTRALVRRLPIRP